MKRTNKKTNKKRVIADLAEQFEHELDEHLAITVLPDGNSIYKEFLIKKMPTGNWAMINLPTKDIVDQFFLKTCALLAAKSYSNVQIAKFNEIKRLDNQYWANHCDNLIYKRNLKTAKEFERYVILLNKLEDSEAKAHYYKEEISRMFKWSFV